MEKFSFRLSLVMNKLAYCLRRIISPQAIYALYDQEMASNRK